MNSSAPSIRVAIVTGAAQGIGRSIALRLAEEGLNVAINDIPSKSAQIDQVVAEIKAKTSAKAVAAPADVTDEDAVQGMIALVVEQLGGLDMVANAGIMSYGPLLMVPSQEWDRVININLKGVMLCYKYAAKQMVEQGRGGRIIGMPYTSAYAASKFAIRGLTQCLAAEMTKHNITVNAYAPGAINTNIAQGISGSSAPKLPMAEPEVIASLVCYIAKPEAYFITGKSLLLCRSMIMQ
ncbi:NAD(P)-binding protein [Daedalea quercina L-15889]|uniref:NAD(P)-binding protein n=1 Tax=Daedalea quercina L-15889 TaxID=1314783 RepID=A0A165TDN9_9APHY|nr:NAD(P)-binding protein [Daedalea quercina L-15889]